MKDYNYYLKEIGEVGYVTAVTSSMVYATGLPHARITELVVSETGQRGIIQSLLTDTVEILMLDGRPVRHGTQIVRTNEILQVPVGDHLLGRSVDAFVNPIDGKQPFPLTVTYVDFDQPAPPIYQRAKIDEPFTTGVQVVDVLVPLGKGQRELVIGDQKSGKTAFVIQAMISQANQGMVCIYAAVGKKKGEIKRIEESLSKLDAYKNIVIVAADASSPASFIYIAPFTAMAVAEYFRDQGREVLLVIDDLNKHAKIYREIALLSRKSPGREAYPGDIFYLHSHLLERAGKKMITKDKATSITVLAVVETVAGDFTGYIQTNTMSITDGHIFFDIETFNQGQRPAVNVPLSVSRVGKQTQSSIARSFSDQIHTILSEYRHGQNYARFGVELNERTRKALDQGEKTLSLLEQDTATTISAFLQQLYLALLLSDFWKDQTKITLLVQKAIIEQAYTQGKLQELEGRLAQATTLDQYMAIITEHMPSIRAIVNLEEPPQQ